MLVLFHALYFVSQYVFIFSKSLFKRIREHGTEYQTLLVTRNKKSKRCVLREIYHVSGEADLCSEYGLRFNPPVYVQRYFAVKAALEDERWKGRIRKVVDFGCAEFGFFTYLKKVVGVQEILEVDIDHEILEAHYCRTAPLNSDYLHPREEPLSVYILKGSIADTDDCLKGCDAVVCIELIEHVYPDVLEDIPYTVFGFIKPVVAIFTTPNGEFNILFPDQKPIRHPDHKFEWPREQFECWATNIALRYPDYRVLLQDIGPGPLGSEHLGGCSQMAVFVRTSPPPPCAVASHSPPADQWIMPICEWMCARREYLPQLEPAACSLRTTQYRLLHDYTYPFRVDTRTPEMKVRDQAEYYIRVLATCERFCGDAGPEIPLSALMPTVSSWTDSEAMLESVLRGAGWRLVLLRDGGWAVAVPPDLDSSSDLSSDTDPDLAGGPQAWGRGDTASAESDWNTDSEGAAGANPWGDEVWAEEPAPPPRTNSEPALRSHPTPLRRSASSPALLARSAPGPGSGPDGNSKIELPAHKVLLTLLPLRQPVSLPSSSAVPAREHSHSSSPGEEAADWLGDSGYPNSASALEADLTPEQAEELFTEYDALSQSSGSDPGSPRPPVAGSPPPPGALLEAAMNVENGDVANNNRDLEGNNAEGAAAALLAAAADRDNDNAPERFPLWLLNLLGLVQGGAVAAMAAAGDSDAEDEGLGAASDSPSDLEVDSDLSADAAEELGPAPA